jgi:hypothetical protein
MRRGIVAASVAAGGFTVPSSNPTGFGNKSPVSSSGFAEFLLLRLWTRSLTLTVFAIYAGVIKLNSTEGEMGL